mmetsp:Transcript_27236/g.54454  ORF Transcript_27236/g.54454 Transcript_27236/m.54454 type:complete len:234 (-) Transcript_27236:33-734(-)
MLGGAYTPLSLSYPYPLLLLPLGVILFIRLPHKPLHYSRQPSHERPQHSQRLARYFIGQPAQHCKDYRAEFVRPRVEHARFEEFVKDVIRILRSRRERAGRNLRLQGRTKPHEQRRVDARVRGLGCGPGRGRGLVFSRLLSGRGQPPRVEVPQVRHERQRRPGIRGLRRGAGGTAARSRGSKRETHHASQITFAREIADDAADIGPAAGGRVDAHLPVVGARGAPGRSAGGAF